MKRHLHFWFSAKQANVYHNNNMCGERCVVNHAVIDGKIVRYTTCSETKNHGCAWDDMVYLGEGEFRFENPPSYW